MSWRVWLGMILTRPVPFHDFTLFVVLSFHRKYSACVGGTGGEKREDNKKHKIIKWDRHDSDMKLNLYSTYQRVSFEMLRLGCLACLMAAFGSLIFNQSDNPK